MSSACQNCRGGTPWKISQAVAAVSDTGAGNQLRIGGRFSVRFAERVERNRPAGRIGGQIAVLQVGWVRPGNWGRDAAGWRVRAEARRRRRGSSAPDAAPSRRSPMGGRSPPVLSWLWLPAQACARSARGPRTAAGPNASAQGAAARPVRGETIDQFILGLRPGLQAPARSGLARHPAPPAPRAPVRKGDRSQNWQHDEPAPTAAAANRLPAWAVSSLSPSNRSATCASSPAKQRRATVTRTSFAPRDADPAGRRRAAGARRGMCSRRSCWQKSSPLASPRWAATN